MLNRKWGGCAFGFALLMAIKGLAWCPEHEAKPTDANVQPAAATADAAASLDGDVKNSGCKKTCKSAGCGHKHAATGDTSLVSDKPAGCGRLAATLAGAVASERVNAVLTSLPAMRYRVGTEETGCPKSAEELAARGGMNIVYVVGEKSFEGKGEATVALASSLEAEIESLQVVQTVVDGKAISCPHAAKEMAKNDSTTVTYRVGGVEFSDKVKAEFAAKLAANAAATVKLSYKVGDASFCCDKMAGAKSKEIGKPVLFVVANEETCCKDVARLLLAQARIRAIVESVLTSSVS